MPPESENTCLVEAPIHQKIKDHLAKETTDERSTTVVLGALGGGCELFLCPLAPPSRLWFPRAVGSW